MKRNEQKVRKLSSSIGVEADKKGDLRQVEAEGRKGAKEHAKRKEVVLETVKVAKKREGVKDAELFAYGEAEETELAEVAEMADDDKKEKREIETEKGDSETEGDSDREDASEEEEGMGGEKDNAEAKKHGADARADGPDVDDDLNDEGDGLEIEDDDLHTKEVVRSEKREESRKNAAVTLEEPQRKREDELEKPARERAERSTIEREIPRARDGKKRHHYATWIWWIIGVAVLVLLIGGGVALAKVMGGNTETDQESVEQKTAEGGEDAEEKPEEEAPKDESEKEEPEKPQEDAKEAPEEPVQQEPAEKAPAVEPRPEVTVNPEVAPGHKVVALTFDDGPSRATTPRLLDILASYNVKATFFVLGTMARQAPDVLQREAAEGHEVASHTPYHTQQTLLNAAQVRAEAAEMDQIFKEILGTVPPFTRPPYGSFNQVVQEAMGQPLVIWSVDPRDWQYRNAATVCANVVQGTFDGSVILVHDIHASTVDAVPCIIERLRVQGYEFLTVSELANYRGVKMVNGGVYGRF